MKPLPMSLRTAACEQRYQDAKAAGTLQPLAGVPSIVEFKFWRIIDNEFCYCVGYSRCHMLLPMRVVPDYTDLNKDEFLELELIRQKKIPYIDENYDQMIENMTRRRSVPQHFHYHLLNFHMGRGSMKL